MLINIKKKKMGYNLHIPKINRFLLNSGERQTSASIDNIRIDHINRYQLAIDCLKQRELNLSSLNGLDVFCGNGYGSKMLSDELNCSMIGIDGSQGAIESANTNYSNSKTFFSYKQFPFRLPQNVSDLITCFESLEHVEEDFVLIEELYNNLKEGGLLFLSTPNEKYYKFQKEKTPFHFKHYFFSELIELINKFSNFKLINWYGQNLYSMSSDGNKFALPNEKMKIFEKKEGQILLFFFQKITSPKSEVF